MGIEYAQIVKMATRNIVNNTGQIPDVPANPRTITQKDFDALKARIAENNLLGMFPLKVFLHEGKYVVLGGNQRLRAAKALKLQFVPCIIAPDDADADTLQEIITLENTHDGEFDWDALANQWDEEKLKKWGVKAANWGFQPEKAERKNGAKRNCIYIEMDDDKPLIIGNVMYTTGDSIDASLLREYLQH